MKCQLITLSALVSLAAAAPAIVPSSSSLFSVVECNPSASCQKLPPGMASSLGKELSSMHDTIPTSSQLYCSHGMGSMPLCGRVNKATDATTMKAALSALQSKCGASYQCGKAALDGKSLDNGYLEFFVPS